jgi:hypothetical protein
LEATIHYSEVESYAGNSVATGIVHFPDRTKPSDQTNAYNRLK